MTSKPFFGVPGSTRAEAAAAFRALPLKERRSLALTHEGIWYTGADGYRHTMTFGIVAAEPHTRRGK
jgi:hypothetical protein